MAIDTSVPRTRRALLAGGIGGVAALTVSAIGRPLPASATEGEVVHVGGEYTASSVTKFDTGATDWIALAGSSDSNVGVYGSSGSGHGVWGYSGSGYGVYGSSDSGCGVWGSSEAAAKPAILGKSNGSSTGVLGYSGAAASEPAPTAKTGVCGYAAQDATAVGVRGASTAGTGVLATATTGTALKVVGKAKFDRANRVLMKKYSSSCKKTLAGVTSSSQVFAVLRTYRSGTYVAAVICGTGYFTIRLNRALTADTYCSYFVVN